MTSFLYLTGGMLLAVCGAGAGYGLALTQRRRWQISRAFGRLLEYIGTAIQYQNMTGAELFARASQYPEFDCLKLGTVLRFGELVPPSVFSDGIRGELAVDLCALESASRETACNLLNRMVAICGTQETSLHRTADTALHLYPRLGGCAGMLAAILLL